jgi:hypothetical protein
MLGRTAKVAIAVAAAMALWVPMTGANAAVRSLSFTNTAGSVTVGSLAPITIPAGDGGLDGTWDDSTGAFTGNTQFNPLSIPANPPAVPVDVVVTLANNGADNVTGTINPSTGVVGLTASMILTINIPSLAVTCSSPAFDANLVDDGDSFGPLPFDPQEDYAMGLDGAFTVPAFGVDCALGAVINTALGLPAGGSLSLSLVRGTPAPPTTPTTPTTSVTTSTAAAAAATSPRFTG